MEQHGSGRTLCSMRVLKNVQTTTISMTVYLQHPITLLQLTSDNETYSEVRQIRGQHHGCWTVAWLRRKISAAAVHTPTSRWSSLRYEASREDTAPTVRQLQAQYSATGCMSRLVPCTPALSQSVGSVIHRHTLRISTMSHCLSYTVSLSVTRNTISTSV